MVDDLQDADDASLRILHHLARSTYEDRVCLVIAHRPTPPGSALEEVRRSLLGRHRASEIVAGPLAPDQIDVLVRRVAPDAPDDVLRSIEAFSGGSPFAVTELARRATMQPGWMIPLDADILGGVEAATREALQRVAVVGGAFDTDEFVAVSGLDDLDAYARLDDALAAGVIEPTGTGYRFRHGIVRDALLDGLPPHRMRLVHRDAADRLIQLGASPARIGHHLQKAGAASEAVPYLLRSAETEAGLGAYRDALELVDAALPHVAGSDRVTALRLRGDLLRALGDPGAIAAYRQGLELAEGPASRQLRVRLARAALMGGDLATAEAALQDLEPDGGPDDADLLLVRGECAFFAADLDGAQAAVDAARALVLAGERNWRVLDLVTLQGLLSHGNGEWSDLMKVELNRTKESPELANAVFDGYLCATEYMVYGPTPHSEIIAVGQELRATAERSGALRAAAFGAALVGEGALLSGDLVLAEGALGEAREMHRGLGAVGGEAIALQGLAELRIAEGRYDEATDLVERALTLARSSIVARHIVQRLFGALIRATADKDQARAVIDRAEASLGWDDACHFCGLMFEVPAALACVAVGDLVEADRHIAAAEEGCSVWQGTSWDAALDEVRAARLAAVGDIDGALALLAAAEAGFVALQHPLDAARCREAAETLVA